jgi:drug/metabolite transporter (DMT)-like permease
MAGRFLGCLMFLGAATVPSEIAGRLASAGRSGWGWFLLAGLVLAGIAVNLWTGGESREPCPGCRKACPMDELR